MTNPTLGRLLISHVTLRGPELHQLYALIADRPGISHDELVEALVPSPGADAFGLDEAPLREALNFLLVAGMVDQQGPSRRKASFRATPKLTDVPFPLLLLHHIRTHKDERQRALALVYAQLVARDDISTTAPALRDQMERGPHSDLFAWTGEKISLWTHLASYLGLVRRLDRSADVLVVPQPTLVREAIGWSQQQLADDCSIGACLRLVDEAFFACFTVRGKVHRGLAQSLLALDALGQIQLRHSADAARSVLVGERRASEVVLLERPKEAEDALSNLLGH
jgi:hypothetical protein